MGSERKGRRAGGSSATRCISCGRPLRPAHRFCPRCGAAAPTAAPPSERPAAPRPTPVASGPSLQVGGQPPAALEEQRKVVTVMFADLSGSTPLAEKLDPEELRGILESYFSALAREIQRFGGTVDKYIGDAVMAVWGAPVSREDDALRAVGAALEMQAAIVRENETLDRRYGVRLALRIGVNTGEVVAGLLAGDVQQVYTVVGDTVNTAQRLESVAAPNTILVGESTYAPARRAFRFESVPAVTLKGKAEPVPAYRAVGPERRAAPREGTTLVGRGPELERLYAELRTAAAGDGRIIHLHADAGVGKSRLVSELLASLSSVDRLWARCLAHESGAPYALIADLLRRTFHIDDAADEAAARTALDGGIAPLALPTQASLVALCLEVLGHGERSPLDPQRKRQLLVSLLRQLLRHRSRTRPLVLVLEDVHWIDATSASVLGDVAGDVRSLRCLVLVTSRDERPIAAAATPMALEPLDPSRAAEMVEAVAGHVLDASVRDLVLERAGGNPFFIEEIVRALGSRQASTLPTTIQDVLEARLDALDPAVRHVGQRGAVIGRSFGERVLARVAAGEDVPAALAALEQDGFIVPVADGGERRYAFRHALLQEVAYQTLLIAQRRRIHTAVGEALEALYPGRLDELLDTLAYHYARSDDDAKARAYLLRAAQRAQRLYAKDEALAYFRSALERAGTDATFRAAALEGIGDVQRVAGAYADALASYDQALSALEDREAIGRARLHRKVGAVQQLQGSTEAALAAFDFALAELPADAESERAALLVELGLTRWQQGRYDDAIAALAEAVTGAERAAADDVRAEAYRQLGIVHWARGDADGSLRHSQRALELYERIGDALGQANVLSNIGIAQRKAGRYEEALAAQTKALEIRERVGEPWGIGLSRNNLAELYRRLGDLDRADVEYRKALELFEAIGYTAGIGGASNGLAATMIEKGQPSAAHPHLVRAQKELDQMGNKTYLVYTERHWALAHLADDRDEALRWAQRAVATAEGLGAPDAEGMSQQVLGLVHEARGEIAEAIAALERSLDLLRHTTERQELGRTLAALARLYARRATGDASAGAVGALRDEARAIFVELGATLDLRRLEEGEPVERR